MPTPARVAELARAVAARLQQHDLTLYAAGLTFYAAIAVVPLMLLGVSLAALLLGERLVSDLMSQLAAYTPESLGLRDGIVALGEVAPRLGPVPLLAALIPATGYGEGLLRAFDRLAGGTVRSRGLRGRLLSLPLVPLLPAVALLGLGAVAVLPGRLGTGRSGQLLGVWATFWVGWFAAALVLAVLYRAFTPRRVALPALLWSAVWTGSFLAGMSLGWVLVLRFGVDVGVAFGGSPTLGTLVLSAVYLFLVQAILLTGYVVALVVGEEPAEGS